MFVKFKVYKLLRRQEIASFSLEAAIILPFCLIFLLSIVLMQQLVNYQLLWQAAGNVACEELESLVALTGSVEHSKVNDQLLGKVLQKMPEKYATKLLKVKTGFLSANYLLRRQCDLLQEINGRDKCLNLKLLSDFKANVYVHEDKHNIAYESSYTYKLFFWSIKRKTKFVVPLWNVYPLTGYTKNVRENKEQAQTIWSEADFLRGDILQKKYSANLPKAYPTINSYTAGLVTSIKSIDLTNPSLNNAWYLEKRVSNLAEQLQAFCGYQPKTANWPTINASDIKQRKLLLIVPENSPADRLEQITTTLKHYPQITYEIVKHEKSYRYIKPETNSFLSNERR